ncbi:MAG: hypothetical protein IPN17_11555 [Deltaproteobacteria bacterium]|nr:hypothetical protein [Deltaproteobacteria bacterium]
MLGRGAQAMPQAPQCARSLWVLTSQPLVALVSQSAKGATQLVMAQLPFMHAGTALGSVQRVSHPPHAATLDWMLTHAPEQQAWSAGQPRVGEQPVTQRLPTQRLPRGQSSLPRHATHWRVVVSQRAVGEAAPPSAPAERHASSERQPGAQALVAATQYCPDGQVSAEARHCTQRPEATSQTPPSERPTHCASAVQTKGTSTGTSGTSGTSTWTGTSGTSTPRSVGPRSAGPRSVGPRSVGPRSALAASGGPPTTELPSVHASARLTAPTRRPSCRCLIARGSHESGGVREALWG